MSIVSANIRQKISECQEMQRLTAAQWSEQSQDSDAHRQQLIIDYENRDTILLLMNHTYRQEDFSSLIQDIYSEEVMRQLRGVIGLRIVISNLHQQHTFYKYFGSFAMRDYGFQLLTMAADHKTPQLQLESLRFLNCLTTKIYYHIGQIEQFFKDRITILTMLLSEENAEILSRRILILAKIYKSKTFIQLLIKEDVIMQLVRVAEEHSDIKIKLQCCWALVNIYKGYYPQIPFNYEIICNLLCKMVMENIVTFKPLLYLCFWFLTIHVKEAANFIMKYRVYEKVLSIDVQTNTTFAYPALFILCLTTFREDENITILFEKEIWNFIVQCLNITNVERYLEYCLQIINNICYRSAKLVNELLNHQNLIPKLAQLITSIPNFQFCSNSKLFAKIFFNMTYCLEQKFIKFENKLCSLGIIKIIVQIMTANPEDQMINNKVSKVLRQMLRSQSQFKESSFYQYLLKLQSVKKIEQKKGETFDKILYQNNQQKVRHLKTSEKQQ